MNYGWVPISDGVIRDAKTHLERVRVIVSRMPDTIVVFDTPAKPPYTPIERADSLHDLIAVIAGLPVPWWVDAIVVGCHASQSAGLELSLYPPWLSAEFEDIERTMPGAPGHMPEWSIAIPDYMLQTDVPREHFFHIKGCSIGNVEAYLAKLREALGGNVTVTAPKFFHGATATGSDHFEWLAYEFRMNLKRIPRPPTWPPRKRWDDRPIKTMAELRARFIAHARLSHLASLTDRPDPNMPLLVNGGPVPDTIWSRWLSRLGLSPKRRRRGIEVALPPSPTGRGPTATTVETQLKIERRSYIFDTLKFVASAAPGEEHALPADDAGLLAALKLDLEGYGGYAPGHPLPGYKRYGYSSMRAFLDGFEWEFTQDDSRKDTEDLTYVSCTGTRYEYVLQVPVMEADDPDPETGRLIFNHYPASGPPAWPRQIIETDPTFFGIAR